jgi:hypothetical protein
VLVRSRAIVHNKYARLWLSIVRAGRKQLQSTLVMLLSNSVKLSASDRQSRSEFVTQYLVDSPSTWSIRAGGERGLAHCQTGGHTRHTWLAA